LIPQKFNILYELERECSIYNFLRKKHYKQIPESVIRNKFSKLIPECRKYLERKEKDTYIIKPLIWVSSEDPRLKGFFGFFGRIKSDDFDFILINENQIPFYLLRKYGRRKGLELEIFSKLRKLKKEYKVFYQNLVKQERKKAIKQRRKDSGTRKSRKTNYRKN
jgi:hypothetical protein